ERDAQGLQGCAARDVHDAQRGRQRRPGVPGGLNVAHSFRVRRFSCAAVMIQLLSSTGGLARHAYLTVEVWIFALAVAAGACTAILGLLAYQFVAVDTPEHQGGRRPSDDSSRPSDWSAQRVTAAAPVSFSRNPNDHTMR